MSRLAVVASRQSMKMAQNIPADVFLIEGKLTEREW